MNRVLKRLPAEKGLLVFAKVPRAGYVKTRLTSLLEPEDACRLYGAFLSDSLHQYASLDVPVHVFVAPENPDLGLRGDDLFVPSTSVRLQRGVDLAERLQAAFAELFEEGGRQLVVIGTDHPTLPSSYIEQAFSALENPGVVVLGPAEDGGYYLLGLGGPAPALFDGMAFSHDRVFVETLRRVRQSGFEPHILPVWYDVDDPDGLRRLSTELRANPQQCPQTRTLLLGLSARYGL